MKAWAYLLILLIFSNLSLAQEDYQPFHISQQYIFEYSSPIDPFPQLKHLGLKMDSSCQVGYPSARPIINSDNLWPSTSLGGEEVCIELGYTQLYLGDTIDLIISHTAKEGEQWIASYFFNQPFYGIVDSIRQSEFLGLTDSVKFIRFGWPDMDDPEEFNAIHLESVQISKNYGLVVGLLFRDLLGYLDNSLYPDMLLSFQFSKLQLVGLSNPEVGLQNTSLADVFRLEIGDELHSIEYGFPNWDSTLNVLVYSYLEFIREITDVTFIDSSQTWRYEWSAEILKYKATLDGEEGRDSSLRSINGIWLYNLEEVGFLDLQPGELFERNNAYFVELEPGYICNLTGKRASRPYILDNTECDFPCYQSPFFHVGPTVSFFPNIGGGYFMSTYYLGSPDIIDLVYYNTAEGSCGDPYDFSNIIINTSEVNTGINFSIYPNPSQDRIHIETEINSNFSLSIFDIKGQKLLEQPFSNLSTQVDISHLVSGIYLVQIRLDNGQQISQRFVKL